MKPLHSNFTPVGLHNRCSCCATKWSKRRNNGTAKHGNSAARQHAKRELNKELRN